MKKIISFPQAPKKIKTMSPFEIEMLFSNLTRDEEEYKIIKLKSKNYIQYRHDEQA